ncbi:hypothetical protein L1887_60838 [Cichorium endivia]|nr:hypothetical protein L1887_60838 [Cichorium endivia]
MRCCGRGASATLDPLCVCRERTTVVWQSATSSPTLSTALSSSASAFAHHYAGNDERQAAQTVHVRAQAAQAHRAQPAPQGGSRTSTHPCLGSQPKSDQLLQGHARLPRALRVGTREQGRGPVCARGRRMQLHRHVIATHPVLDPARRRETALFVKLGDCGRQAVQHEPAEYILQPARLLCLCIAFLHLHPHCFCLQAWLCVMRILECVRSEVLAACVQAPRGFPPTTILLRSNRGFFGSIRLETHRKTHGSVMTITKPWSWRRLADAWNQPASEPAVVKPRARRVQHIETIGGGATPTAVPLVARLPTELVVHIVLIAADAASSRQRLELARVSRACHRAILSTLLLPNVRLYAEQLRAFAIALDKNRLGIRELARTRVRRLTVRTGKVEGLFDASQAQVRFERHMLPFLRLALGYLEGVQGLVVQGVPKQLELSGLREMACIMGHWGGDVQRGFWQPQSWTELKDLQLHGPHFRLTPQTAATMAALPALRRIALVVPAIVPQASEVEGLQVAGRINPLQRRHKQRSRWSPYSAPRQRRAECIRARVSDWMMHRAQHGQHWFDTESTHPDEALEYVLESFEPATPASSLPTSTTGGSTPFGVATPHSRRQEDPIDPAELLADDSDDS